MTRVLRALSLFSGAGGADMALEAAGIEVVGLCEIEPHARAVLRYHWPTMPLHGDVCLLDGTKYRGIDLVVGGSPCQDLSVAGKRGGLEEGSGTRSSLFFEQVRIWNESGALYLAWENVFGALSSNGGADFAAVLSALVGAAIPVPANGWSRGGVAAGRDAVAAWRVLDLQHFGVPQRRERVIVLAARAGGVDPAEVLALAEGVRGDPAPRFAQREGAASAVATGVGAGSGNGRAEPDRGGTVAIQPIAMTLLTTYGSKAGADGHHIGAGLPNFIIEPQPLVEPVAGCLQERDAKGPDSDTKPGHLIVAPFNAAQVTNPDNRQQVRAGDNAPTLDGTGKTGVALAFKIRGGVEIDSAGKGAGKGYLGSEEMAFTLGVSQDQHIMAPAVARPLLAMGHDAGDDGTGRTGLQTIIAGPVDDLGVRMLTPRECERIMGWPDDWTRWGTIAAADVQALIDEEQRDLDPTPRVGQYVDGNTESEDDAAARVLATEKEIKRLRKLLKRAERAGGALTYELPDTPRYQLCGNGIGKEWMEWIACRLVAAESSPITESAQ